MTVFADQLLHGYADGHRLLAGSVELSQAAMRALLVHSDAPAAPMGQMALSSIPLPEDDRWAITATWRADEMPRPGSVWSHTLILEVSAIAAMRCAGGLLDQLRRPQGGDLALYRRPVAISERPAWPDGSAAQRVLAAVLLAFYSWPDQSAGVIAPKLEQGEAALLAVWEQQWPRLRSASSFSARGRLEADNKSPVQVAAKRGRTRPPIPVIDASRDLPEEPPSWIARLLADVERPGALRAFLALYGPHGERGRADVSLLVELQQGLASSAPQEAFALLVRSYPAPPQMDALKHAALEDDSIVWPGADEGRLLAAYEHHRHVQWASLRLGDRLAQQWPDRPAVLIQCLRLAQGDTQLVTDAWRAVAARADDTMLKYLLSTEFELALELVALRPDLLLQPSLWRQPFQWQRPLAGAVADRDGLERELASVLIEADNAELAAYLRRRGLLNGHDLAATIAARGVSAHTRRIYGEVFRDAIDEALGYAMLDQASSVERTLAALLGGSRNPVVRKHSDQLAKHLRELDAPSQLELAVRLMLATDGKPPSKSVMRVVFPLLHRALVGQSLSAKQWKDLDEVLPAGNQWDRAERLRKALLASIKHHNWSDREVAQAIAAAGPEAGRLRELTEKKSDLRKAIDAAWKLISPW